MKKTINLLILSGLCLFNLSCTSHESLKTAMKPKIDFSVQDKYLKHLSPVFNPLTETELLSAWGKEYQIGLAFAKKLDLYSAITSFKRADILIPDTLLNRKAEIQYQIINCYYLGKKYFDVIDTFENSILAGTDRNFIGFHDLLIILADSYIQSDNPERANFILRAMKKFYPVDAKKLELTSAILKADLFEMKELSNTSSTQKEVNTLALKLTPKDYLITSVKEGEILPSQAEAEKELIELEHLIDCQNGANDILKAFHKYKKNPSLAGFLNATIPGLGYLYIGQKQSAFTAFSLNALFIASTAYFIKQDNIPAALITLSFETGWYLGGIIGAKEGAILHNERLFETHAHYQMRDHKLFPILMLQHGF
jgi:tetratricopeptide (TPR) repeat protein